MRDNSTIQVYILFCQLQKKFKAKWPYHDEEVHIMMKMLHENTKIEILDKVSEVIT